MRNQNQPDYEKSPLSKMRYSGDGDFLQTFYYEKLSKHYHTYE